MATPPKIQQVSIRVPTTMNEIQAGFMVSALGWFFGKNTDATVNLVWDPTKNTNCYTPLVVVYTSGNNGGQIPAAMETRKNLQSYVEGSAEIPAGADAAAHARAFETVAQFRRTQVSSALGYT